MPKAKNSEEKSNGSALGIEAQLWAAADKMRGHMDASEYKHVVLGLIFLKHISRTLTELLSDESRVKAAGTEVAPHA